MLYAAKQKSQAQESICRVYAGLTAQESICRVYAGLTADACHIPASMFTLVWGFHLFVLAHQPKPQNSCHGDCWAGFSKLEALVIWT